MLAWKQFFKGIIKDPNLSQGPIMTKGNLHQNGALPQIDEAPLIQSFDIVITS